MKRTFPVIALAVFSTMLGMGIISPLIPIYTSDLGASGIWVGLVYGAYAVSRAVFIPFIGKYSDKWGRKQFLAAGLLIYAMLSLGYVFAESATHLFFVRIFHGAASGMIVPIARAWVAEASPHGDESRWQGYFNTAFFSGSASGPLIGGLIGDHFGFTAAFATMGAINGLAFLGVAIILPATERGPRQEKAPPSYRKLLKDDTMKGLFIQRMIMELSLGAFIAFFPLYVNTHLGLSLSYIGGMLAGALFVTAWLQLLTGKIADKYNRRKVVIMGNLITFLVLSAFPFATNFGTLVALILIRSIGGALAMPANSGMMVERGRAFGMGSAVALLALATSIGMASGPILGGVVVEWIQIDAVFYFATIAGVIGIIFYAWYTRSYKKPEVEKEAKNELQ